MRNHFYYVFLKYMTVAAAGMFLVIYFFMYITLTSHYAAAAGTDPAAKTEYYLSVPVNAGDSLWEISRKYYSSEYKSMHRYIRKIMNLNHLPDGDIYEGTYLIIPYYDQVQAEK